MKQAEPDFAVGEFLGGARQAYEMILMAFERGDISEVRPFLAPPVAEAFQSVIDQREAAGQTVEAQYLGTRETTLAGAEFDRTTGEAEVSVRFLAELIVATRDADGNVVEGDPKASRKQKDTWTFARAMGSDDPNCSLSRRLMRRRRKLLSDEDRELWSRVAESAQPCIRAGTPLCRPTPIRSRRHRRVPFPPSPCPPFASDNPRCPRSRSFSAAPRPPSGWRNRACAWMPRRTAR